MTNLKPKKVQIAKPSQKSKISSENDSISDLTDGDLIDQSTSSLEYTYQQNLNDMDTLEAANQEGNTLSPNMTLLDKVRKGISRGFTRVLSRRITLNLMDKIVNSRLKSENKKLLKIPKKITSERMIIIKQNQSQNINQINTDIIRIFYSIRGIQEFKGLYKNFPDFYLKFKNEVQSTLSSNQNLNFRNLKIQDPKILNELLFMQKRSSSARRKTQRQIRIENKLLNPISISFRKFKHFVITEYPHSSEQHCKAVKKRVDNFKKGQWNYKKCTIINRTFTKRYTRKSTQSKTILDKQGKIGFGRQKTVLIPNKFGIGRPPSTSSQRKIQQKSQANSQKQVSKLLNKFQESLVSKQRILNFLAKESRSNTPIYKKKARMKQADLSLQYSHHPNNKKMQRQEASGARSPTLSKASRTFHFKKTLSPKISRHESNLKQYREYILSKNSKSSPKLKLDRSGHFSVSYMFKKKHSTHKTKKLLKLSIEHRHLGTSLHLLESSETPLKDPYSVLQKRAKLTPITFLQSRRKKTQYRK